MKMIIIGVLLLSLIAGACTLSAAYVTRSVEETEHLLHRAMETPVDQNPSKAIELVKEAETQWDSCSVIFGTVLRHDEVDDVVAEFARLESSALTRDHDEYLRTCAALLAQLRHIRDMEWPTLKNIL